MAGGWPRGFGGGSGGNFTPGAGRGQCWVPAVTPHLSIHPPPGTWPFSGERVFSARANRSHQCDPLGRQARFSSHRQSHGVGWWGAQG